MRRRGPSADLWRRRFTGPWEVTASMRMSQLRSTWWIARALSDDPGESMSPSHS